MFASEFLAAQIHAIEKALYIASEKANRDLRYDYNGYPSEEFFFYWIQNHSKGFREAWHVSLCKSCKNVCTCHDCLKDECLHFEQCEELCYSGQM